LQVKVGHANLGEFYWLPLLTLTEQTTAPAKQTVFQSFVNESCSACCARYGGTCDNVNVPTSVADVQTMVAPFFTCDFVYTMEYVFACL
jgi:hypothetical protein